jgi:hypothetical protein
LPPQHFAQQAQGGRIGRPGRQPCAHLRLGIFQPPFAHGQGGAQQHRIFRCRLDPGNIGAGRAGFVPRRAQQAGQGLPAALAGLSATARRNCDGPPPHPAASVNPSSAAAARARLRRRQRRQHATRLVQPPQRARRGLRSTPHGDGQARPADFAGLCQGQRRLPGQQAGSMAQRGLDRAAGRRPKGRLASALGLLRRIRPALAGPLVLPSQFPPSVFTRRQACHARAITQLRTAQSRARSTLRRNLRCQIVNFC